MTHDISWAAGFFEGEGHVSFITFKNKKYQRNYSRLIMSIAQVDKRPLEKFVEVFNLGKVRGPYGPYRENKQGYYQFQTGGEKAVIILEQMLPYLFHKGEQAIDAIKKYREYNDK